MLLRVFFLTRVAGGDFGLILYSSGAAFTLASFLLLGRGRSTVSLAAWGVFVRSLFPFPFLTIAPWRGGPQPWRDYKSCHDRGVDYHDCEVPELSQNGDGDKKNYEEAVTMVMMMLMVDDYYFVFVVTSE